LFLCTFVARGQVTIFVPQANIQSGSDYNQQFSGWNYISLLGVAPTFRVNATTANFSGSSGVIPLDRANISLVSVGGLQLIGLGAEQPLSTANAELYTSLVSLLSGPITASARIGVAGFTWRAGFYSSGIAFTLAGINLGGISPSGGLPFQLDVPGFIDVSPAMGTMSLHVNDLNYYRSAGGISVDKPVAISTTVPYIPSIQAGTGQFNFNTSYAYHTLPAAPVSAVNVALVAVPTAITTSLSTTSQMLTAPSGVALTQNNQTLNSRYSIDGLQLKTNFLQAGTYSVPVDYAWTKLSSVYPAGNLQAQSSGTLEVLVSDLTEILVNQQEINLDFNAVADYTQGVVVDLPALLRVSKTAAYNLTVRASSSSFQSSGSSIPLNVLRIGPASGEIFTQSVTLSEQPQGLIEHANPEIDRNVGVRFSIPSSETQHLLGKPVGSYSADIIFGIVAP